MLRLGALTMELRKRHPFPQEGIAWERGDQEPTGKGASGARWRKEMPELPDPNSESRQVGTKLPGTAAHGASVSHVSRFHEGSECRKEALPPLHLPMRGHIPRWLDSKQPRQIELSIGLNN